MKSENARSSAGSKTCLVWVVLALLLSFVGTAGSLALSLGPGLKACPLCFYQRSFMMGTFAVLALGLAVDLVQSRLYCLLAIPLVLAGWGVAVFHEYLLEGWGAASWGMSQNSNRQFASAVSWGCSQRWPPGSCSPHGEV